MSQPQLKLYQITALISRSAVILATSEKDALEHVKDWEDSWESHSDFIGVTDHTEVDDVRELNGPLKEWKYEAHDLTHAASQILGSEESLA